MKKCSKCNKELNVNNFYKDKSKKGGIRGYCKVCDNERANKYRKERPEVHKKASYKYSIKNRYGMTLKDYEELMEKQKGVCKICENVCFLKQKLSIDHDHKTNKVGVYYVTIVIME